MLREVSRSVGCDMSGGHTVDMIRKSVKEDENSLSRVGLGLNESLAVIRDHG